MDWTTKIYTANPSTEPFPYVSTASFPTRERLKRGFSCLKNIQMVRNHRQDPHFGRAVEERIVWRELLDLELQNVDEQIDGITSHCAKLPETVPPRD